MNSFPSSAQDQKSHIDAGNAHRQAGQFSAAAAAYLQALAKDPNCAEALVHLGSIFDQHNQAEEALKCYERALQIKPDYAAACFHAAGLYKRCGREAEAVKLFLKGAEIEPEAVSAQVHFDLARHLISANRLEEGATSCRRALKVAPNFLPAQDLMANLAQAQGKLDDALRLFDLIMEQNPAVAQFNNLEHVNYSFLSRRWSLLSCWDELTDDLKESAIPKTQVAFEAQNLILLGNDAAQSGRLDAAIAHFTNALKLAPDSATAHYSLGLVLGSIGNNPFNPAKLQKACEHLEKVIQLEPRWAEAHFHLGRLLGAILVAGGRSNLQPAINLLEKAAALKPCYAEAYEQLGIITESPAYFDRHCRLMLERAEKHPLGALGVRVISDVYTHAMGHLASGLDVYLKAQALGWIPRYQSILLAPPGRVANPCLLGYWKKYLHVVSDEKMIRELRPVTRILLQDAGRIPCPNGKIMNAMESLSYVQTEWEAQGRAPLLSLSDADRERGWQCLKKMGVPDGVWFVTMHVREGGYKREGADVYNASRNADVETYLKAVKTITNRGGWVIRVGEPTMKPLVPIPQVVDYARSKFKCDWMDIFLCSQCRFYMGASGGLFATPHVFGVPILATNWPAGLLPFGNKNVLVPKLFRHLPTNRHVSFREFLSAPIVYNSDGVYLRQIGLEHVDNTEDELNEAAVEMLQRVEGTQVYSEVENERQRQLESFLSPDYGLLRIRWGRDFMARHADLL